MGDYQDVANRPQGGGAELCGCGLPLKYAISSSEKNPNRPYAACPQPKGQGCGQFNFLDEPAKKNKYQRKAPANRYNPVAVQVQPRLSGVPVSDAPPVLPPRNIPAPTPAPMVQQPAYQSAPVYSAGPARNDSVVPAVECNNTRISVTLEQMLVHVQQMTGLLQRIADEAERQPGSPYVREESKDEQ